jgi:hypothetical protein
MERQPGSLVFGIVAGLLVAVFAYRWITTPEPKSERLLEEMVIAESRRVLALRLRLAAPEIVDPLAPRRSVGKVYIYPAADGWEVSGYYRRDPADEWHAYLVELDAGGRLRRLRVRDDDPRVAELAIRDPALEALP